MKKMFGFNLVELLIAVAIIGILATIALPQFSEHVRHEKRLEAEISLIKIATALEQYFTLNNTYQHATLSTLGFKEIIANGQYRLLIAKANDSDYELQAIPQHSQLKDAACATLMLNSSGKKEISGSGNLESCWQ